MMPGYKLFSNRSPSESQANSIKVLKTNQVARSEEADNDENLFFWVGNCDVIFPSNLVQKRENLDELVIKLSDSYRKLKKLIERYDNGNFQDDAEYKEAVLYQNPNKFRGFERHICDCLSMQWDPLYSINEIFAEIERLIDFMTKKYSEMLEKNQNRLQQRVEQYQLSTVSPSIHVS